MQQKFSFCFALLKLSKIKMFFRSKIFFIWMKGKNRPDNLTQMTQTGRAMKKVVLKQGEVRRIVETGRFYIKLFMSICTRENSSHPALVSCICWNFTLIVTRYCRHVGVLFFMFFSKWKQD